MSSIFKPSTSSSSLSQATPGPALAKSLTIRLRRLFPFWSNQGFRTSLEKWDIEMPYTTHFEGFRDPHMTYEVTYSDLDLDPPFRLHTRYKITFPGMFTRKYTFIGAMDLNPDDHNGEEWVKCFFLHPDLFHQVHLAVNVPKIFVWVKPDCTQQDAGGEQCPRWWKQALHPVQRYFHGDRH